MEFSNPTLDAEANRHQLDERIARASGARISSTTHRRLLARQLRRLAERLDN